MDNSVYVLMDSWSKSGSKSLIGVYCNLKSAKLALADYVLGGNAERADRIEIVLINVEVSEI